MSSAMNVRIERDVAICTFCSTHSRRNASWSRIEVGFGHRRMYFPLPLHMMRACGDRVCNVSYGAS